MLHKLPSILVLLLFACVSANAQRSSAVPRKKKQSGIAAIPMLNYNRTQGLILGALVSKYYKLDKTDTLSPSSTTGFFGMYTTEKSYATFAFSRFYFSRDRWRALVALGASDINFQFYLEDPTASTGNFYDYSTKAKFVSLQLQRNIFRRIYFGPTGSFINTTTDFGLPGASGMDSVSISTLNNVGYIITNDTRDHVQYPTRGMFVNFKNQFYRDWAGSDYQFERYLVTYNQFFKLSKNDDTKILALRASFNIAAGDVPFEGQSVVGGDDIRGYSQGKYRADQVYTLQTEYRWNFYKRWGMVAFAGIASAVANFGDVFDSQLLPGAGAGIRFRMLPAEKINIGIDGALGKDDYSITFRIGESFSR